MQVRHDHAGRVVKAAIEVRADEGALLRQWQRRDAGVVALVGVIGKQILLDVRRVHVIDEAAVGRDVAPTARSAFGPAKSPMIGTIRFFRSYSRSARKFSSVARYA